MATARLLRTCASRPVLNPQLYLSRAISTSAVTRARRHTPINHVIHFVPHQEEWIVELFGKYSRTLKPGLNLLVPFFHEIKYIQSLKEQAIEIPSQSAITEDNVTLHIDGILYLKVFDSYKASYGVEDAEYAMIQLAQTTMRSELGKIALDRVFQERTHLNASIVEAINIASAAWGIVSMRYEIRDIQLPSKVKEAMQMQVEAERKKRAAVLESEGARESAINRAEGLRQSKILTSEAEKIQQINRAQGEAAAMLTRAHARSRSLDVVGKAVGRKNGSSAASLSVAEQYVDAFKSLAKTSNTVLLPEKTGDVSSMVAQAMGIYSGMVQRGGASPGGDHPDDGKKAVKDEEEEGKEETVDFEKEMEEIIKQVESQNLTGKATPADASSLLGQPPTDPLLSDTADFTHQPHMTISTSPTRRKLDDR